MPIVSGKVYLGAAERTAYVDGCCEAARAAPGCVDFVVSADPLEPGRVDIYGRWETDESLEAFRGSGPPPGQRARIRAMDVARCRISSVEAL